MLLTNLSESLLLLVGCLYSQGASRFYPFCLALSHGYRSVYPLVVCCSWSVSTFCSMVSCRFLLSKPAHPLWSSFSLIMILFLLGREVFRFRLMPWFSSPLIRVVCGSHRLDHLHPVADVPWCYHFCGVYVASLSPSDDFLRFSAFVAKVGFGLLLFWVIISPPSLSLLLLPSHVYL